MSIPSQLAKYRKAKAVTKEQCDEVTAKRTKKEADVNKADEAAT